MLKRGYQELGEGVVSLWDSPKKRAFPTLKGALYARTPAGAGSVEGKEERAANLRAYRLAKEVIGPAGFSEGTLDLPLTAQVLLDGAEPSTQTTHSESNTALYARAERTARSRLIEWRGWRIGEIEDGKTVFRNKVTGAVQTSHPYMGLGTDADSRAAAYNLLKVYEAIRKRLDGEQADVSTTSKRGGSTQEVKELSSKVQREEEEANVLGSKVREALAAFRSRRRLVRPIPSPSRGSATAVSPLVQATPVVDASNDAALFDPPSPLRRPYAAVASDLSGNMCSVTALSESLFTLSEDLGWDDEGADNFGCNENIMDHFNRFTEDSRECRSLLLCGRSKATPVAVAATPAKKTTERIEAKGAGPRQDTPVCVAFFDDDLSGEGGESHVAAGRSSTSEIVMGFDEPEKVAVVQDEEDIALEDDNDNDDDDDFIPPKPGRQSFASKFTSRKAPPTKKRARQFHGSSLEDPFEIEFEAETNKVNELRDHQQQSSEEALAEALSYFAAEDS